MKNFMETPTSASEVKESVTEETKAEGENKILTSAEITPAAAAEIKKEDAGNLEAKRAELKKFDTENKNESQSNYEKFSSLAAQKLDEMQAEIDSKKKGAKVGLIQKALNMLYSEEQIQAAENAIKVARKLLASGELPDMTSVKSRVKLAESVDVSELPERAGKQTSYTSHSFGGGA